MDNKNLTMKKEKIEALLENLTSATASFAYEAKEPDFHIEVSITCEDGWARAKII